jgi:hypothetical protein
MKLVYRVHAVRRMLQRQIDEAAIRHVLKSGEVIARYPKDKPYPSRLLLGWVESLPLHVLAVDNIEDGEVIIITVYQPDPVLWSADFRTRRKR